MGPGEKKVKVLRLRSCAGRGRAVVVCGKLRRHRRRDGRSGSDDGRNVSANRRNLLAQRGDGATAAVSGLATAACGKLRRHLWRHFISRLGMVLIHGRLIHPQIEFCPPFLLNPQGFDLDPLPPVTGKGIPPQKSPVFRTSARA